VQRFLATEAAGGILLLAAAVAAFGWANSPWRAAYDVILHTPFGPTVGRFAFQHDLQFWVNDGLMSCSSSSSGSS
jgi:NhaA family Na+:H+ antiporter